VNEFNECVHEVFSAAGDIIIVVLAMKNTSERLRSVASEVRGI
jgi:hypothetical protein